MHTRPAAKAQPCYLLATYPLGVLFNLFKPQFARCKTEIIKLLGLLGEVGQPARSTWHPSSPQAFAVTLQSWRPDQALREPGLSCSNWILVRRLLGLYHLLSPYGPDFLRRSLRLCLSADFICFKILFSRISALQAQSDWTAEFALKVLFLLLSSICITTWFSAHHQEDFISQVSHRKDGQDFKPFISCLSWVHS